MVVPGTEWSVPKILSIANPLYNEFWSENSIFAIDWFYCIHNHKLNVSDIGSSRLLFYLVKERG